MKNTLLVLLTVALAGTVAFSVISGRPTSPYLFTAVDGSIKTIASTSGYRIQEQRRGTANPKLETLNSLSTRVTGKPVCNDIDEYLVKDGSDSIRVKVSYALGKVGSVEILADQIPSKQAEAFRAGLVADYPGLDCHINRS